MRSGPSEQCDYISDRAKMYVEIAETKVQKISDGSVCNLNDTYSASYLSKYNIAVGSKFIVYKN